MSEIPDDAYVNADRVVERDKEMNRAIETYERIIGEYARAGEEKDAELTRLRAELAKKDALLNEARDILGDIEHTFRITVAIYQGDDNSWMEERAIAIRDLLARLDGEKEGGRTQ